MTFWRKIVVLTLLHTYLLITLISFLITSLLLCIATLRHVQEPMPALLPAPRSVPPPIDEQDTLLLPRARPRKPP